MLIDPLLKVDLTRPRVAREYKYASRVKNIGDSTVGVATVCLEYDITLNKVTRWCYGYADRIKTNEETTDEMTMTTSSDIILIMVYYTIPS